MSNTTPAAALPQPAWRVVSQQPAQSQDGTGRFVPGRRVTFQLASGSAGTVWLPDSMFTAEAVKAAIEVEAAKIRAVDQLTAGP